MTDRPSRRDDAAAVAFVRTHTALAAPELVPELRLHLVDGSADGSIAFWERTETALDELGVRTAPFWAFPWVGGQVIARYVLDHPELVAGRRVLDLACGSGIGAIAAARAGAATVLATEIDPVALAATALNAAANGVTVEQLFADVLDGDARDAEVVLAGDLFYERPMADRVLPFLLRARREGAHVLVGDPGRSYLPRRHLEALCAHDVPVDRELEGTPTRRTTVWQITDNRSAQVDHH